MPLLKEDEYQSIRVACVECDLLALQRVATVDTRVIVAGIKRTLRRVRTYG